MEPKTPKEIMEFHDSLKKSLEKHVFQVEVYIKKKITDTRTSLRKNKDLVNQSKELAQKMQEVLEIEKEFFQGILQHKEEVLENFRTTTDSYIKIFEEENCKAQDEEDMELDIILLRKRQLELTGNLLNVHEKLLKTFNTLGMSSINQYKYSIEDMLKEILDSKKF